MNNKTDISTISAIRKYSKSFNSFGNDYIFFHLDGTHISEALPRSFRIEGVSIFLCVKGETSIRINFEEKNLGPGSLLMLDPDTLIEVNPDNASDFEAYALFLAPELLSNLSFDLNAFDYRRFGSDRPSVLQLSDRQQLLIGRYFELMSFYASKGVNNIYTRNIVRSLIAAVLYQLMDFATGDSDTVADDAPVGRRSIYVQQFMELLRANFRQERTINFYASRLFISPKYLSMVLKETTGMSATEWIDRFVVMEAKNLLRYSGKNVQQIAYELNFANQSSFGKYFKLQTGQSPTSFRKK